MCVFWVYWGTCSINLSTGVHFSHTEGCSGQHRENEELRLLPDLAAPALCGFILKALKMAVLQFSQHFPDMKKRKRIVPARSVLYQENNLP